MSKSCILIFTSLFIFCQTRLFVKSRKNNNIDYDEIEKIAKENNDLLKKLLNEINIKQSQE